MSTHATTSATTTTMSAATVPQSVSSSEARGPMAMQSAPGPVPAASRATTTTKSSTARTFQANGTGVPPNSRTAARAKRGGGGEGEGGESEGGNDSDGGSTSSGGSSTHHDGRPQQQQQLYDGQRPGGETSIPPPSSSSFLTGTKREDDADGEMMQTPTSTMAPLATTAATTSPTAAAPTPPTTTSSGNAGTKRPLATTRDGRQLSEKRLRRLEKNRLSARECRRRKREAAQNLQREINILEGENLRLRLQLQIGEEAEETSRKEQQRLTEGINALLKSGASEGEVYATIEEFKEKFADYGRDRRSAIEFHLRNVERLLMPTTTTSVAMRALQGGSTNVHVGSGMVGGTAGTKAGAEPTPPTAAAVDSAGIKKPSTTRHCERKGIPANVTCSSDMAGIRTPANADASSSGHQQHQQQTAASISPPSLIKSGPASPDGTAAAANATRSTIAAAATATTEGNATEKLEPKKLFEYLVRYLEVTPEQAAALKDSRYVAKELDELLAKSLSMLQELRERLMQCGEDLEAQFNSVRAILTPTQAAKFLVWVANNSACMHMLNELWNKVYPKSGSDADGEGGDESITFPST